MTKHHALAIIGGLLILASVAACSTGTGAASTPTAIVPRAATAAPNDRVYAKADLARILAAVNTKLKLGGTVETKDGPDTDAADALDAAIAGSDVTFTPAACASLITSDQQLVTLVGSAGLSAATLSSPQLTIIATTVTGAPLPASVSFHFIQNQKATLTTCKHLAIAATLDGQKVSATIDFDPLPVTTDAGQAIGFREGFTITGAGSGSSASSHPTLEAIDGNLLLFVSGVSVQDEAGLTKAVDAVVAAARN